jgi:hypothetical protein
MYVKITLDPWVSVTWTLIQPGCELPPVPWGQPLTTPGRPVGVIPLGLVGRGEVRREGAAVRLVGWDAGCRLLRPDVGEVGPVLGVGGGNRVAGDQRFKELIGVTPKRLARTYRFAATVFAINPAGPIDWGDLAYGAGYFDQAQLRP